MIFTPHIFCRAGFCLIASAPVVCAGERTVRDRAELAVALREAQAGDTIRIAAGTYAGGLMGTGLAGTKEKPILFTAEDPARPPVIEGGASGIQFSGCSGITLRHVHFRNATANGLNIDDGGSGKPAAKHIVLEDLKVEGKAPAGNLDGIKLSGLEDFAVTRCTVIRWGTGGSGVDMVGCHRGVISGCHLMHSPEAAAGGANGVQMKGGTEDITVRHCRFEQTGARGVNLGGSTGEPYFRPLGAKYEARNLTVEDCSFTGMDAPVAFVGVDGATVQHNTIWRPGRWALRILQENTGPGMAVCRKGVFRNNIIVFQAAVMRGAVNTGPNTAPETFSFSGNVWHAEDRPEATKRAVSLPVAEKEGVYDKEPLFKGAAAGDFTLTPASPVQNAGARTPGKDGE